jgi:hypothetical protein
VKELKIVLTNIFDFFSKLERRMVCRWEEVWLGRIESMGEEFYFC